MKTETPQRRRALSADVWTLRETGPPVSLTIPADDVPGYIPDPSEYPPIPAGSLVVIRGHLMDGARLGHAIGHAIDQGSGAVAVRHPVRDGHQTMIIWSCLPQYRIGQTVGIDRRA